MTWAEVLTQALEGAKRLKTAAQALQYAAGCLHLTYDVGYYVHPITEKLAAFSPVLPDDERTRVADLLGTLDDRPLTWLTYEQLSSPYANWVKAAHSPTLRRLGELTNFFPGQYPGGLPNAPSPLAAMLTSGLLGAGLGWGAGTLAKQFLPRGYGQHLGRTGAILGGAIGAMPGAAWGGANRLTGRSFNDPALLASPWSPPYPFAADGANANYPPEPSPTPLEEGANEFLSHTTLPRIKLSAELAPEYRAALRKIADTFGEAPLRLPPTASDVNINHLGQTLWETGASPSLAATTMGAMYAAQQMPDPRSRPGLVTGGQLGQLTAHAIGDYARGYLVGAAINAAIGTPWSAGAFGGGAAALGILGTVVPRLFGK